VNYPGNPRFKPRCTFEVAKTTDEMEQKRQLLTVHAVVVTDEGPMGIQAKEEVKNIICHHFGIQELDFYVYHCSPESFIAFFYDTHDRDVVFVAGRVVDGPMELGFHAWDLDRFGERELMPYHVRLSLEGIPQHAWCRDIIEKVLCDEAIVHHVEEVMVQQVEHRIYECWALSKDPSRIPQSVYLSLAKNEADPSRCAQTHLTRPRSVKDCHVFRILIHIDVVEDLMFYHYPRAELIEDGRVPWREFKWQYGRADGDLSDEDTNTPIQFYGQNRCYQRRDPNDDDDYERDQKRSRARGFFGKISDWRDSRGKSRGRQMEGERGRS
jgi:hypothetical protein